MILIANSTDIRNCGHSSESIRFADLVYMPTEDGGVVLKNRFGRHGDACHDEIEELRDAIRM